MIDYKLECMILSEQLEGETMGKSLTYKILANNLLEGELRQGSEIAVRVNQTLTQDSTGTMVYLQLEAMNVDRIKTDLSVAYIDHNMLQAGFENADDHEFIKTIAQKYGIIFSKPGGGICHQVHLERFAKPGAIMIGSDSHTPTCGGLGSLAIGAGGLDVAVGMAKGYYYMSVPKVYNVILHGDLKPFVNGKDIILKVLQHLSVKGGVGYVMEYSGDGIEHLSVTDRATICNMGAELGATTSIFPSDVRTYEYLNRQGRANDYHPMQPDIDAEYDAVLEIDLNMLTPLTALPHMPDNVIDIASATKVKVDQVAIGSCTNSSYSDMMKVAAILKNNQVHPDVSLVISPGSSNVLRLLAENGALADMIKAGARILESACGPCIGMGQAPKSGAVSLRSFNRNFKGRSGTMDAQVYLVSPETAAASAVAGYLSDPTELTVELNFSEPESYGRVDTYFIFPTPSAMSTQVVMGPNIKPFPIGAPIADKIEKSVLLKTGDNVTTDDIVPSNAKLLPFRSNIPYLSTFCFGTLSNTFKAKAEANQGGFVIGGENYGQGSSREHAALVPLYLGVRAVIAKSFARIHRSNLINAGILPLVFSDPKDYDLIDTDDVLVFDGLLDAMKAQQDITVVNKTKNKTYTVLFTASGRERDVILSGGYLNYSKNNPLEVTPCIPSH